MEAWSDSRVLKRAVPSNTRCGKEDFSYGMVRDEAQTWLW